VRRNSGLNRTDVYESTESHCRRWRHRRRSWRSRGLPEVIDGAAPSWTTTAHTFLSTPLAASKVDDACDTIMDGTHFSPANAEAENGCTSPLERQENRVDLTDVSFISEAAHRAIYNRCPVKKGDVLYVKDVQTRAGRVKLFGRRVLSPFERGCSSRQARSTRQPIPGAVLNTTDGRTRMLSMCPALPSRV